MPIARKGKIARLPFQLREELNYRLRDNQSASTILPWLNDQAGLKGPAAINDGNLSEWRAGGFADWLERQDRVEKTARLAEFSMRIAEAGGGTMNLPAAIAGGQIMEVLEEFDPERVKRLLENDPEQWLGLLATLAKLQKSKADELAATTTARQNDVRLEQMRQKLALERDKFQRTTGELFLKWFKDARAREIAESKVETSVKVDQIRALMFGAVEEEGDRAAQ